LARENARRQRDGERARHGDGGSVKKIGHERGSGRERERESEQGRAREEIRPSPCAPDGTVAGMGGAGARVGARAG